MPTKKLRVGSKMDKGDDFKKMSAGAKQGQKRYKAPKKGK